MKSMAKLPHYCRYSQTCTVTLDPQDGVYDYIQSEFYRSLTQHRGPRQHDPHRAAPEVEILRVERIFTPRLQEKYLVELQDIAGLCNRRLKDKLENVNALRVQSFEGFEM